MGVKGRTKTEALEAALIHSTIATYRDCLKRNRIGRRLRMGTIWIGTEQGQSHSDHRLRHLLSPLSAMRLSSFDREVPDERDRGYCVNGRVEAKSQQRQGAGTHPDDDRGAARERADDDAEDRKPDRAPEQLVPPRRLQSTELNASPAAFEALDAVNRPHPFRTLA